MRRKGYCIICGACCNIHNFPKLKRYKRNPDIEFDAEGWCTKINKETKQCTIYATRPYICRENPKKPLDIAMIPQCRYYFE